nr:hypothetical protein [Candidatus Sigynarchaeota archaeon]
MVKDDIINFRISTEEKDTWIAEQKKRGKDTLSEFIKDCVFRVIAGFDKSDTRSMDDGGKLDQILQLQREQLVLAKEQAESRTILAGLRAQMARQAKLEYDQADNDTVLEFLKAHGESTLKAIGDGTNITQSRVFKAIQVLEDLGSIDADYSKRPNTFKVRI